jgi:hypothetical protein
MRRLICLMLLSASSAVLPLSGSAAQQTQGRPTRVPLLVAISPDLDGAETRFRLARFAGNAPLDVILLAPNADASVLTQGVEALLAIRRQSGDVATSNATLRSIQPQRARALPWAARVVQDVHAAAPRQIPGLGRLRAVQIWLPAQRRGGRAPRSGS